MISNNERYTWLRSRTDRALAGAAIASLLLSIPSAAATRGLDYDTLSPVPPVTAEPFPATTSQPSAKTQQERACRAGIPVSFSWLDMGVVNAPIEQVGTDTNGTADTSDDAIEEPHGRGKDGGYNTVAWWNEGPLPCADNGTPVFLAHSTLVERSLFPRTEFAKNLGRIKELGASTTILIELDNGSVVKYEVSPDSGVGGGEGIYPKVAKAADTDGNGQIDYADVIARVYSSSEERVVFTTCAGSPNVTTGTSVAATIVSGKPVN